MDKTYKVSQVIEAKGGDIVIDNSLSTTSINPVQNKVITNKLMTKQDTLIAGDNITIIDNVISSTGGGGTIPPETLAQIEQNKTDIKHLKEDYVLPNNFDINNFNKEYISPRVFAVGRVKGAISVPDADTFSTDGLIELYAYDSTFMIQVWHPISDFGYTRVYIRASKNSGWTSWKRIDELEAPMIELETGLDILSYDFAPYPNGSFFKGNQLAGIPVEITNNKDVVIELVKFDKVKYKLVLNQLGHAPNIGTYENYYYTDSYQGWTRVDQSVAPTIIIPQNTDILTYEFNKYPNGSLFIGHQLTGVPEAISPSNKSCIRLVKFDQSNYKLVLSHFGQFSVGFETYENYHFSFGYKGWKGIDGSNKQDKLTAGNGITISPNNEISSKVRFYQTLPPTSSLKTGDIVLVPSEDVELLLTKEY